MGIFYKNRRVHEINFLIPRRTLVKVGQDSRGERKRCLINGGLKPAVIANKLDIERRWEKVKSRSRKSVSPHTEGMDYTIQRLEGKKQPISGYYLWHGYLM